MAAKPWVLPEVSRAVNLEDMFLIALYIRDDALPREAKGCNTYIKSSPTLLGMDGDLVLPARDLKDVVHRAVIQASMVSQELQRKQFRSISPPPMQP